MRLIECHIENFGKLSNFDYKFLNGLNTIKQENGFGKTTFASFIKAMFYGMEIKKNTKMLIDRKKYEPWQGGNFGGSIVFEVNGKQYKLERFFGKKEADDTFKVFDLKTNLESNDFGQNIGEEIFKLNKEAYERSTFISGQDIETSMNDSINAKLSNILESENDVNTSEKAILALEEAIKNYKKTGGRGEINEKNLQKTFLIQKIEQSKIDELSLQERKQKYDSIINEIKYKELEKEKYQCLLKEQISIEMKKAKQENYKILKSQLQESENKIKKFKEQVEQKNEFVEKKEYNEQKLEKLNEKITEIEQINKKSKIINIILLISLVLFSIFSIIILFMKKNKSMNIIIAIIEILILIYILIRINSLKNKKQNLLNKKQEKQNIESLLETINSLYKKEQEEKNKDFIRLQEEYNQKKYVLDEFEKNNNINEINDIINYKELNTNYEHEINIITEELNRLSDEKNYIKNQIEILESNLDEVNDLENEMEELEQKIQEMQDSLVILEKTKKYLEKAKEEFSSHYLQEMKESFNKNINIINGKDIKSIMDVNLNVQINERGTNKEIKYFSSGYKDLIYICIRLSLIEALFKEEKPFIILDDPFINLDEEKIKNAIEVINKISKEYQIIYFVCHNSRV